MPTFAGSANTSGAANMALGQHSTTSIDVFSMGSNQAAAAFFPNSGIGMSYRSSFFPNTINRMALFASHPLSRGVLGGNVRYLHYEDFHTLKVGFAYALRFSEVVSIGIQLDYLHWGIAEGGAKHFATFEAGLLLRPAEKIDIGIHIDNPVKWAVNRETGELLPIVLKAGLRYRPAETLTLVAEMEKELTEPFSFSAGMAYEPIRDFSLRTGYTSAPLQITFGVGYRVRRSVTVDIASLWHPELGFQTAMSFAIEFGKKEENEER